MGQGKRGGHGRHALHPRHRGGAMTSSRVGGPRRTGRYLLPDGPFLLAPHVLLPGAIDVASVFTAVRSDWDSQAVKGNIQESTVITHKKVLATFESFARGRGAVLLCDIDSEMVWQWLESLTSVKQSQPTEAMRKLRRTVAITFFRTTFRLGLTDRNPADSITPVVQPERFVCALSVKDIERVKEVADLDAYRNITPDEYESGSSQIAVAVALTLIGSQGGEIAAIRGRDLDLIGKRVWAHDGGIRITNRWLPIDDLWAFDVLAARIAFLARKNPNGFLEAPIAYLPRTDDARSSQLQRRQSAAANLVDKAIKRAGLKQNGRIRMASITEYLALRVFQETGRVEAVALRLGMRSLDRAAHVVGYDWRTGFTAGGAL